MKSKYTKIKYTNSGVKAPLVTLMKSIPDLDRSDMIKLNFPEMNIFIARRSRKTMYTRAQSIVYVCHGNTVNAFYVYDTINDARIMCENLYISIKKPELDFRITTRDYDAIYEYMKGVLYNAKES
jgi:Ca2+-binding EF-hand superfamily protein